MVTSAAMTVKFSEAIFVALPLPVKLFRLNIYPTYSRCNKRFIFGFRQHEQIVGFVEDINKPGDPFLSPKAPLRAT
jgi:hypothetical protein